MRKFLQFTLSLLAMLMVTLNANAWKFTLNSPTTEEVEEIYSISISCGGMLDEWPAPQMELTCPDGTVKPFNYNDMDGTATPADYQACTAPGVYTLKIPAGKFHMGGAANEEQTFTWTIKDPNDQGGGTGGGGSGGGTTAEPWTFASVTPAQGEVESITGFEFVIGSSNGLNQTKNLTLKCDDGSDYTVFISDNYTGTISGSLDSPITAPGTYTLNIPAGYYEDWALKTNAEMTYTWTIAGSTPPAVSPYTLTYDKAGEFLKLTKEGCTSYEATYDGGATLEGYNGFFSFNPADPEWTFTGNTCIGAYVALADGTYTLHVQSGTYLFDGVANEAIDIEFTVGNGGQGGGGNHEFDGQPYHEQIFKAGETAVSSPIVFNTNGVSITTVDGEFKLGTEIMTIPFGYNTYSENELDWNNKCQLVITAKEDINKIILVPTASGKDAIQYASAEGGDGEYNNGVWEGKLAKGETLTLTSNDGTQIKEIYICYNGDDFDPIAGGGDEKGVITISYPVENQLIASQTDGGHLCTFTTNKEYAQVTVQIINSNPIYDNLDAFPVVYVDNTALDGNNNPIIKLQVGENYVTAATPASGTAGKGDTWYFYKGDSYKMVVKGFLNMWDVMPDNYDAIAEVNFVGDGKEHVAESIIKLLQASPASGSQIANVNGVVTLEFDGAVKSVKALTPGGQMDPTINYTATPKAGSDNKVWEINLGDRSNYASADTDGNPIIEVDVTATADDGIIIFSDDRADRALVLTYELVADAGPTTTVTLGTPTWSVAENAEIEATTESINIKFPNATNVEGTYTLEVAGTIADKQFNFRQVSGTGTMADGADIAVTLSEDVAYNLTIGTITVKDASGVTVYSTENGNYQLNFGTKATPAAEEDITVQGTNKYVQIFFDNHSEVAPSWNAPITVNGETVELSFGDEWNELIYTSDEGFADGKYDVVFSVGSLTLEGNDNPEKIEVTYYIVDGVVTMTGPQPTEVVLYEMGVNPEVAATTEGDARDLVIEGTDVTLAISNTSTSSMGKWFNNAYIDNSKGGITTTNTNVMKFTSSRTIEKIEFTANKTITQKNGTSCVGTFADNVWTGEASEISIAIGANTTYISKIVVYFKEDSATGINNAASVNVANDKMYNLAGQQIKVAKGIVIKNGKKMFVK